MGCDIHFYVERRVDGRWVSADKWETGEGFTDVDYDARFYSGRNYDLFSILANVRNGSGFAGCDTGDGFVPMAEPRGLPADASPEVAEAAACWDGDGHSHSYLTVAEIMAYDWTQTTKKRGWVSAKEYADWKRWSASHGEGPKSWSGGVMGPSIKHVTPDELDNLLKTQPPENLSGHYCQVEWETPYSRSGKEFLGTTLPRLWRLGAHDDVRAVFWFDN